MANPINLDFHDDHLGTQRIRAFALELALETHQRFGDLGEPITETAAKIAKFIETGEYTKISEEFPEVGYCYDPEDADYSASDFDGIWDDLAEAAVVDAEFTEVEPTPGDMLDAFENDIYKELDERLEGETTIASYIVLNLSAVFEEAFDKEVKALYDKWENIAEVYRS